MKYNKKSKLKLATAALLMGGLFNAQAFSLSDYFPKDDANDDMAQEAPAENAAPTTKQAKPAETYKMGRAEQYDQWILQCAESTTSGNEKCNLIHQLVNDKKQQIVKIEVLKQGANNLMLLHLPLGTYLPAGAVLIVGEGAYKMPITVCMPAGCKASMPLDWNLNQQLKREDKAIVQLLNVNQKQKINIEFSLMGFSNGSKEIK